MLKYKPKGLSEEWLAESKEIETLNVSKEIKLRLKDIIAMLNTCDVLIDKLASRKKLISKMEELQLISYYFFAHSYHMTLSIYHLSKFNFGASSLVLVRSVVEACIDFSYLWLCKKINGSYEERAAWGAHGFLRRKSIEQKWEDMQAHRQDLNLVKATPLHLFEQAQSLASLQKVNKFKNRYGRKYWAKITALDKRARAVDDTEELIKSAGIILEQVYTMCYKWTSELVHSESASLNTYIHKHSKGYIVDFGPNGLNIGIALPMTMQVLLAVLHMFSHINRLNVDLLEELKASGCTIFPENAV